MDFSETSDGDDDDDVETFCALSLSLSLVCEKKRRGNRHRALSLPFSSSLTLAERARSFCQQTAATNNIILIYSRGVFWIVCLQRKKKSECACLLIVVVREIHFFFIFFGKKIWCTHETIFVPTEPLRRTTKKLNKKALFSSRLARVNAQTPRHAKIKILADIIKYTCNRFNIDPKELFDDLDSCAQSKSSSRAPAKVTKKRMSLP